MIYSLIAIGLAIVLFYLWFVRYFQRPESTKLQPVDIDLFEALFRAEDEQFLTRKLGAQSLRTVRRSRTLAKAAYVRVILSNSAALIATAQGNLKSPDPALRQCAASLLQDATRLRISSIRALVELGVQYLYPSHAVDLNIATVYEDARRHLSVLLYQSSPKLPSVAIQER